MVEKRWFVPALFTIGLIVLAVAARWWLPPLLTFVGAHTDLIQGLTDLVQLLLWIGAAVVVLAGLWRGWRTKTDTGLVAAGQDAYGNVILVADPDLLWQAIRRRPPAQDLRQATERYLAHLVDRYRYLDFKGMGVSDRVPLRLPLVEMYVPLKARVELPEGETWTRQLRLAGRKVSADEAEAIGPRLSEPTSVLDLLRQHDGLIILGDPGAGKTTFLKYLALRLAMGEGASLGLAARLPVLLPLSAYASALVGRDVPLDRFIAEYDRDRGVDLPIGPMLDEALAQGGALLLLDGLDEVRDLAQRHLVVNRVVEFITFHRRKGNKFVLTSRIVGYRQVRPTCEGLAECTLIDFSDEDITLFVEQWTGALERAARGNTPVAASEAERERQELLEAVGRNPGVRRLAANPLLLTVLALMKRQGVTLPERRVELYQKYIETLLKHWNLARGLDRPPSRDLDVVETVRVLAPLALWMHEVSPGVGLVKREDVRRKLVDIYAGREIPGPEKATRQLLADVREHAGLLLERGLGEYGFIHLTFQEYLAAVAVALRGQREVGPVVEVLAAHVGDDNWHEVTLLTIGYMGIVQQRDEAAGVVLHDLIQAAPGEPGQAAVLAGRAVIDAWPGGVTTACKAAVVQALQETLAGDERVKPTLRAAAGDALARLGDPRPGVGVSPETGLPEIVWCEVPAGPFLMGSTQAEEGAWEDERPQHTLELPAFLVSRCPVTNAQYRPFLKGGGYGEPRYWTAEGWAWRTGEREPDLSPFDDEDLKKGYAEWLARRPADKRDRPFWWDDPRWGLPNRPVVGVSWYEALAYCRWLTEQWQMANGTSGVTAGSLRSARPPATRWRVCRRRPSGRRQRGVPAAGAGPGGMGGSRAGPTRRRQASGKPARPAPFRRGPAPAARWTWRATCGSGRTAAGGAAAFAGRTMSIPTIRAMGGKTPADLTSAWCAGAPGAIVGGTLVALSVAGASRSTVSSTWGFGWWCPWRLLHPEF